MDGHMPHSLEYLPFVDGTNKKIIHYTCNAPSEKVLNKHRIESVGEKFGCASPREVLLIPNQIYLKKFSEFNDKSILILNLEKLIRTLR